MSNTPHDLAEDFPGDVDKIHALKAENAHFARLVEEYQTVNVAVHRAETRLDTLEELAEVALRKTRAGLKDDISRMLAEA
ncbi:YdcH family protein [Phaeovulum sp. W22_SRMD_FR3]|uniref:YdcH family protein n=1 Tax=Phaeovulum sp. W22_SRMD_FR3 TaxID=3240274 RepID=UPI003F996364